jgi:hypothetical protein
MLFDLRGRRRRAVQATYLMLAVLLGGGLVLFGIGGDVSGGLVDAFRGGGSGDTGNSTIRDRVERQEERLQANPQDEATLETLIRDYFSLAMDQRDPTTGLVPADARDELRQAGNYWQRYLEAVDEPSADTAQYAFRIYGIQGLGQPKEAQRAAEIMAREGNDVASYLVLVQAAALAGDTRTADLATTRAVDLAPKDQKKQVQKQADALKKQAQEQQPGG